MRGQKSTREAKGEQGIGEEPAELSPAPKATGRESKDS